MSVQKEGEQRVPISKIGPVVLAILDGWGIAPDSPGNAIALARTPFLDGARKKYPHTELKAHGRYVGLLPDQEGNSEAGHINIGAGRTVRQDIVYVTEAIKDGTFFKNVAIKEALKHAQKYGTKVHVMGLLTNSNSAHASPFHLQSLLRLLREEEMKHVLIHLFTDGRDSSPYASTHLLHELESHIDPATQRIATIQGRFYAMDRNKHWNRTELAYNAVVAGEGVAAPNAHAAILRGYNRGESDEFILPTVITDAQHVPIGTFDDNDVVIFFNLRSDRTRQLTKAFVQKNFETANEHAFKRKRIPLNMRFVAMTDFGPDLQDVLTAFPSRDVQGSLTETLNGFRQFYIAESEKYAHVTYFFNGGFADKLRGEDWMRVPSPFVPHYDSKPEMRAPIIADEVVRRLKADLHDFVCINFANADMVGHTGNLEATIAAVECVDKQLAKLAKITAEKGGTLVITADHGNAETKINAETGEVLTEHTANPVPFVVVGERFKRAKLGEGMLADVAPTILDIMNVPKPPEMTGFSLLR